MATLRQILQDRELTQAQAAELLEVSQPRVSDLVRGKIDMFSIEERQKGSPFDGSVWPSNASYTAKNSAWIAGAEWWVSDPLSQSDATE
jgi:hypothetical protein